MKVKSTEQLLRQIRILKREKMLLEKKNQNMLRDWMISENTIKKSFQEQIKKITAENRLLSAKNQLLESMKK